MLQSNQHNAFGAKMSSETRQNRDTFDFRSIPRLAEYTAGELQVFKDSNDACQFFKDAKSFWLDLLIIPNGNGQIEVGRVKYVDVNEITLSSFRWINQHSVYRMREILNSQVFVLLESTGR
jgi:hypothetical protein